MSFPPPTQGPFNFPAEEETVLQYWRDIDAFQTSLKQSEGKPRFTFFDGPPFATGKPHHGHLLAGTVKDIITRHAHTTGHHVERRFGWDTHGLPVEHEIDKKLGITGKEDVMKMGIETYNAECRSIVMRYSGEWKSTVERMGRWIDFEKGYKTLDPTFMESVWWVFGQLFNKDLVYRGLRVMPYSTGLRTPLSNFEAGSSYKDVNDPAVTVAFPLIDDPSTSLLAWTTTPWTLPSNLGICVHPDFTYLKIHDVEKDRNFIIHEDLLKTLFKDPNGKDKAKWKKVGSFLGKDMKGWRYEPLFDYFVEQFEDRAFRVVCDTYVGNDAGTGLVHQAPAFGEDDHRIAIANGIITKDEMPPCPIDETGKYTSQVPEFEGVYVKDADKDIMKLLKSRGRLIVQGVLKHSYPFCPRSGTPLLYKAIPVWMVKVEDYRDRLIANNNKTRWVPEYVGENRFGNWLKNARDWNISRNRYWGTPIPLWVSDDLSEVVCIGSIAELQELSGVKDITEIHRHDIDAITIPSKKTPGTVLRRVEEVFDCWFESGSMPYAQNHYPFENKDKIEGAGGFPADFIAEGIDQTRGWFYTLLVLATHLFDTAPWKNVICTGLVLAADGRKMSKSLRNFTDPVEVINKYGADALRMFLVNSPIVRGDNLNFKEEGVKLVISRVLLPWVNSYNFFASHAALLKKTHGIDFVYDPNVKLSDNVMDRWVLARCQSLIKIVHQEMDAYRLYTVIPRLINLIEELTNSYIRFNRKRMKGSDGIEDSQTALNTLFEALFTLCQTMSSFTPFITENLYQRLRQYIPPTEDTTQDLRSIHFLPFPKPKEAYTDEAVQVAVRRLLSVITIGRKLRDDKSLDLKTTPLKELVIFHPDAAYLADVKGLEGYLLSELNIESVRYTSEESDVNVVYKALADWPVLGRRLRGAMPKVKAALAALSSDQVKEFKSSGTIDVAGQTLTTGDLTITASVDFTGSTDYHGGMGDKAEAKEDGELIVVLDIRSSPELILKGLARGFIASIQQLRKKAGLQATDDVDVFYRGTSEQMAGVIQSNQEAIGRETRSTALDYAQKSESAKVLFEEEVEIADEKVMLTVAQRVA